jgi:hypothetical protein
MATRQYTICRPEVNAQSLLSWMCRAASDRHPCPVHPFRMADFVGGRARQLIETAILSSMSLHRPATQSALRQSVRHVGHSEAGIAGLREESSGNYIRNLRHAGTAPPDGLAPRPQYLAGERRGHCPPGSRRKETIRHISILEVEQGGSIAKRGTEAWRAGHPPLQGRGDSWTLIFRARWRC